MPAAFQVQDLRKIYRQGGVERVAVNGISFSAGPGQLVGFLGPNGAGKTTTIKCALGLVEPTSGVITIAGHDVLRHPGRALRHVGAVLEGSRNVYWKLTALENLLFFANLVGIPTEKARQQAYDLLERFDLLPRAETQVGRLSRGMQQKVAICAALIRNPQVLLLDEPTLGLDLETAAQLRQLLVDLVREHGRTVVVSSHQLDLIEAICEEVVILRQGEVVAQERVDRLLNLFATRAYRFYTEDPLPAAAAVRLRASFPAAQIETHGAASTVDITLDHGRQLYDAMQIFRDAPCVLRSVEHRTPNLEEVFLRLVRGESA